MDRIHGWIARASDLLVGIAALAGLVMMTHIVLDVFAKYLFNSPIDGTIETVAGYYMVVVVFFPFAYVAYKEGHIIVELFTRKMSPRNLLRLDGVIGIFTFLYMTVFAWKTVEEAIHRTIQLEIWETGSRNIPIWPSRWLIPIGCGVMAVYVLYRVVHDLRGQRDT